MGFLDLSVSVASKKHVDFSDARYQSVDRLRRNMSQKVRSTFTLYDNKEYNKTAIQEITTAYELSDKKIPVGELLNKMVDLIVDLEDGVLNKEKDAIYAWKYSVALLEMYEDKVKRQEQLSVFDNSLKTSIINSKTFIERYPGKYTNRTNFFSNQVKDNLTKHVLETFKEITIPAIHNAAINQSREKAEKHNNPTLDRIVQWAIDKYGCEADSFYKISEDPQTKLLYSTNTIIVHLKNGYDMSIVGYVGTEFDDQFSISILDAQKIVMEKHDENVSQEDIQKALSEISENAPIDPLSQLLDFETRKNAVLTKQYEILTEIRPMIPAEVLALKAAESVVGKDYIWGCEQFRTTHEDLPSDFKLEDVELPQLEEPENKHSELLDNQDMLGEFEQIAVSMADAQIESEQNEQQIIKNETREEVVEEQQTKYGPELPKQLLSQETTNGDESEDCIVEDNNAKMDTDSLFAQIEESAPAVPDLFEMDETPKVEEKKFGDPSRIKADTPLLAQYADQQTNAFGKSPKPKFDPTSTLLPGFIPPKKAQEEITHSFTQNAQPVPEAESKSLWKEESAVKQPENQNIVDKKDDVVQHPDSIDDLDSLFV